MSQNYVPVITFTPSSRVNRSASLGFVTDIQTGTWTNSTIPAFFKEVDSFKMECTAGCLFSPN